MRSHARWPLLPLLLAALSAGKESLAEPPAEAQGVEGQIAELVRELSRRAGILPPEPDARLSRAAADIIALCSEDTAPGLGLMSDALHLHGIVEPPPHMLLSSFREGSEAELMKELRRVLEDALSRGRWRRLGVGQSPSAEGKRRILLLLQESFIELAKVPRSLEMGKGEAGQAPVNGYLHLPYRKPEVLVTNPTGQVARVSLTVWTGPQVSARGEKIPGDEVSHFAGLFRCHSRGRHQIEVVGDAGQGPTVLANFPVYCGLPAPQRLSASREVAERPFATAREAEEQLLELLNSDRERFGLRRLVLDPRLSEMARAHSADMRDNDFVAHVSPRSGGPSDRARRAGIEANVLLENLARAYSPKEAERGLMDSPGHRANILSRQVSRVGIGVAMRAPPGGVREIWVTQLFAEPPEEFDAHKAPGRALRRIDELRREAHMKGLRQDADLMSLAGEIAEALSQGKLSEERVGEPAEKAVQRFAARYRLLRTVLALSSDLSRLSSSPALLDPKVTHIGCGVAPAHKDERRLTRGMYVVMVLGQGK